MRKIVIASGVLTALYSAVPGQAAINRVQSQATFTPSSPCSATFSRSTAGDLIVVWTNWSSSSGSASASDTFGDSYAIAVTTPNPTSSQSAEILYATVAKTGANNTVTVTAPANCSIVIVEYSGLSQAAPLDVLATNICTALCSTNLNSTSVLPNYPSELVFGAAWATSGTAHAGSGFGPIESSGAQITEDEIVATDGSRDATASLAGASSPTWIIQMVAFRDPVVPSTAVGANRWAADQSFNSGRPWFDVMGSSPAASGSNQSTTVNGIVSSGATSIPLTAAKDFANNQQIAVAGLGPPATIQAPTNVTITFIPGQSTTPYVAGYTPVQFDTLNGVTCSAGVATLNTRGPHGLTNGNQVNVSGFTSSGYTGYNGTNLTVTVTSVTQFTYTLAGAPGNCNGVTTPAGSNRFNPAKVQLQNTAGGGQTTVKYQIVTQDTKGGFSAATTPAQGLAVPTVITQEYSTNQALCNAAQAYWITNPPPAHCFFNNEFAGHVFVSWTAPAGTLGTDIAQYLVYGDEGSGGALTCLGPARGTVPAGGDPAPGYADYFPGTPGASPVGCPPNAPVNPPALQTAQYFIATINSGGGTITLTTSGPTGTASNATACTVLPTCAKVYHEDAAAINACLAQSSANPFGLPPPPGWAQAGGGTCVLPLGYYNAFAPLVWPDGVLTNLELHGWLSLWQPWYTDLIHGDSHARLIGKEGAFVANQYQTGGAYINCVGVNPCLSFRGGNTSFWLEKLTLGGNGGVQGDGVYIGSDNVGTAPAQITFQDVSITTAFGAGAFPVEGFAGTSYAYEFTRGFYSTQTHGLEAISLQGVGGFSNFTRVNFHGGGIWYHNPLVGQSSGCPGHITIDSGVGEVGWSPFVRFGDAASGYATCSIFDVQIFKPDWADTVSGTNGSMVASLGGVAQLQLHGATSGGGGYFDGWNGGGTGLLIYGSDQGTNGILPVGLSGAYVTAHGETTIGIDSASDTAVATAHLRCTTNYSGNNPDVLDIEDGNGAVGWKFNCFTNSPYPGTLKFVGSQSRKAFSFGAGSNGAIYDFDNTGFWGMQYNSATNIGNGLFNGTYAMTVQGANGHVRFGTTTVDPGVAFQVDGAAVFASTITDSTGATVKGALTGTTGSIGGSSVNGGACTSGTVNIAGVTTSMALQATPAADPGASFLWTAFVSSGTTVTVRVCNFTASAATPTATTYNVRAIQ